MNRRQRGDPRHVLVASDQFLPWDLGTYVSKCLRKRGSRVDVFAYGDDPGAVASRGLVSAVRRLKPDVVIGLKLRGFDPGALAAIRAHGTFVVLWYVDCFTERIPGWLTPLARQANLFATTAHGMVPRYSALGVPHVSWIPEGVHLPDFRPQPLTREARLTYGAEIAFVGTVFQPPVLDDRVALRRWHLLATLGKRFRVKVWGPQGRPARTRGLGFPPVTMIRWPAYNEDLVRICHASAIVLGINTVNSVHQYFSNRTFLTLASGGFHITHYVPGLEELFENHRHLVWYRSDSECLELCAHYLTRPTARRRIAESGRRHVRRRWTMTRQISKLFRSIEDVRGAH